jgi:DNA polymerase-4
MRKIIHVDMDAFFAAIEQRDDPALRGRPIAVGGGGPRGVVMTASYEARRFGVRSAMPGATARRLCPQLLFVPPRFDAYKAASRQIRMIFARHTALVEPLSLDEAYLDVTEPLGPLRPAVAIAGAIKAAIRAETGLTASAGVSYNKFLAKIASDMNKPDGLTVVRPRDALRLLAGLPIERFHGIGPATAARLRARGIATGADLQVLDTGELLARCGRAGPHYGRLARGIDERPVEPRRPRRSLGIEDTFGEDLRSPVAMAEALRGLAAKLAERLRAATFTGRTLTLKIKYADFTIRTRGRTLPEPLAPAELEPLALELLRRPSPPDRPVRLLGLTVSQPPTVDGRQLELFALEPAPRENHRPAG